MSNLDIVIFTKVLLNYFNCSILFSYRYLSDGLASSKSDVYAFGVVLFEIISGKEAIIRTEGSAMKNTERRSLASIVSIIVAHSKIHALPLDRCNDLLEMTSF